MRSRRRCFFFGRLRRGGDPRVGERREIDSLRPASTWRARPRAATRPVDSSAPLRRGTPRRLLALRPRASGSRFRRSSRSFMPASGFRTSCATPAATRPRPARRCSSESDWASSRSRSLATTSRDAMVSSPRATSASSRARGFGTFAPRFSARPTHGSPQRRDATPERDHRFDRQSRPAGARRRRAPPSSTV